ncbi:MAG: PqqD family protein [Chitinivibrionales bacterium]|nr:PqqD family protein [Chitinivibrionales bacterium]
MNITQATVIAHSNRIAARLFEGKMLIVTVDDSQLHRVDEVGTFIWDLLENPLSVTKIINAVAEHFDEFNKENQKNEIISFLEDLLKKKLIIIQN